jgi:hypothetical protein
MSPEERQLLAGLFDRTRSASNAPRDRDAEAFITDAVRTQPFAPYLLAQTVLVQEEALRAAANRLQELEAHVKDLESQPAPASTSFLGGLGQSLFGGSSPTPQQAPQSSVPSSPWGRNSAPPPPPQQAGGWNNQPQQQQPGPWQQQGAPQGGGFLKGALGAAAGVAGGVLLADSIRGLMGGHNSPLGIGSGFGGGMGGGLGGETINNYYGGAAGSPSSSQIADMDRTQDELQDAADDADHTQDELQDASDYGNDSGGSDDSTDV